MPAPCPRGQPQRNATSGSSTCAVSFIAAILLAAIAIIAQSGCSTSSAGDEQAESAGSGKKNTAAASHAKKTYHTLALSTEFVPYQELGGSITGQLVREIGRQAILIAARDELGLATRDETLGELKSLRADEGILRMHPQIRSNWRKPSTLTLLPGNAAGGDAENAIWQTSIPVGDSGVPGLYPKLAQAWEAASRNELVAGLRQAGLTGQTPPPDCSNQPPEEVLQLLSEMNFISQLHAVQLAHQAIAERGASAQWLEVLSRGYAHLCSLTVHHWTSGQEAFAARALLYAERCGAVGGDERRTNWLRAYVLAIIGAHADALSEIEKLGSSDDAPDWAAVVEPFCRFEREELQAVGAEREKLKQLTSWLAACLGYFYDQGPSFHTLSQECLQQSPDAFAIYRQLVVMNSSLGDQRYGAFTGPVALSRFLPMRLMEINYLPKPLRDELSSDSEQFAALVERLPDPQPHDPFTPVPRFIFTELRAADQDSKKQPEPSWAALADLIEEEQFVMVASFCSALLNAVESSYKETIEGLLPLVEGHRYEPFIATYALDRAELPAGSVALLNDLEIAEPRHNMADMFWRATEVPTSTDLTLGYASSWEAMNSYDYRLPSMHEELVVGIDTWWQHLSAEQRQKYITYYKTVSPHCPHWLRMTLHQAERPTAEQLDQWAPLAKKDATSSRYMGWHSMNLGLNEKAAEWYEAAYQMEPSYTTTVALADLYRDTGKAEKWLPTLERFLNDEEERGLDHSNVHRYIATTYMEKDRDFARAKPHALLAAQSYSADGLKTAAYACEGLADWDEATHWAREVSHSYPTWSGNEWYSYCRRTGRSDPAQARPYMEQFLAAQKSEPASRDVAAYRLLEGEKPKALEMFLQRGADTSEIYWYMFAVLIADDLDDMAARNRALAAARNISTNYVANDNPNLDVVIQHMCGLAAAEDPISDAQREAMEADMAKLTPAVRRDYECFAGRLLELRGDLENADRLLRSAVSTPPFDNLSATMAGHFLVERHGVSRDAAVEPPQIQAAP